MNTIYEIIIKIMSPHSSGASSSQSIILGDENVAAPFDQFVFEDFSNSRN